MPTSPAVRIAQAIKNESDPDRPRRVAARLHEMRQRNPTGHVLEKMELYKRLGGAR